MIEEITIKNKLDELWKEIYKLQEKNRELEREISHCEGDIRQNANDISHLKDTVSRYSYLI